MINNIKEIGTELVSNMKAKNLIILILLFSALISPGILLTHAYENTITFKSFLIYFSVITPYFIWNALLMVMLIQDNIESLDDEEEGLVVFLSLGFMITAPFLFLGIILTYLVSIPLWGFVSAYYIISLVKTIFVIVIRKDLISEDGN